MEWEEVLGFELDGEIGIGSGIALGTRKPALRLRGGHAFIFCSAPRRGAIGRAYGGREVYTQGHKGAVRDSWRKNKGSVRNGAKIFTKY